MKEAKNIYEQLGGTYRNEIGYRIPNLALPDGTEYPVSKYGRIHLNCLSLCVTALRTSLR